MPHPTDQHDVEVTGLVARCTCGWSSWVMRHPDEARHEGEKHRLKDCEL
jgi:hypothetical protein